MIDRLAGGSRSKTGGMAYSTVSRPGVGRVARRWLKDVTVGLATLFQLNFWKMAVECCTTNDRHVLGTAQWRDLNSRPNFFIRHKVHSEVHSTTAHLQGLLNFLRGLP